jgi:hypothetical protein
MANAASVMPAVPPDNAYSGRPTGIHALEVDRRLAH